MKLTIEQLFEAVEQLKSYHDNHGGSGDVSTLSALEDVSCDCPTDGQVLVYSEATQSWTNKAMSGSGLAVGAIIIDAGLDSSFLPCDGSVLNISDYPLLADYFTNRYGSANYFGGDGVATFALPLQVQGNESSEALVPTLSNDTDVISSGAVNASYAGYKAFDNNTSTWWSINKSADVYLGYAFSVSTRVNSYSLTSPPGGASDMPYTWRLEAYNEETSEWVTLDEQANIEWSLNETKRFTLNAVANYAQYRVYSIHNSNSSYTSICELQFYKELQYNYIKYI